MEKVNCYCIKDSNGRFGGKLNIYSNSITGRGDYKWSYYSSHYPTTWYEGSKVNLETEISKLRELNALAEFELDWEVVEFDNRESIIELSLKSKDLGYDYSSVVTKNIAKNCIGKHRKMVKDIYKKYKDKKYITDHGQLV
jgi:hypothetical protein